MAHKHQQDSTLHIFMLNYAILTSVFTCSAVVFASLTLRSSYTIREHFPEVPCKYIHTLNLLFSNIPPPCRIAERIAALEWAAESTKVKTSESLFSNSFSFREVVPQQPADQSKPFHHPFVCIDTNFLQFSRI